MKSPWYRPALIRGLALSGILLAASAWGSGVESGQAIRLGPEEIHFAADASRPGHMAVALLYGDMAQAGLYAARVLIPAGLKVMPHRHPESRVVAVVSGTLLVGFGERFDASELKALPAGSFFTEPPGRAHFVWARDGDVVVQVSGIGPSGTEYLQPGE